MKTNESILADFISDFELELPGIGVCFDANIEFTTASIVNKFKCEVHIITMALKQESVIYLLNKELTDFGIPDTFSFDPDNFFYDPKKSLTIIDYDLLRGKYSLVIVPEKVPCNTESRLAEKSED